jgi:hypothetical protein
MYYCIFIIPLFRILVYNVVLCTNEGDGLVALNTVQKKMLEIANQLNNIRNLPYDDKTRKNYDKKGFIYDIEYTIGQLKYFFDTTVPSQTGVPNTSYYYLKQLDPKEHQIAYVNLTRGFPKELFGGHYCYILRKFKDKYIVIPTTSVEDETDIRHDFEIDIKIKNFINNKITRLNVSNIRAIDIQRIYQGNTNLFEKEKGIFDVITDRSLIINEVSKILFNLPIDKYYLNSYNNVEEYH